MLFQDQPPAQVQQKKQSKPDVRQKSTGANSPNVITGNNSTVNINASVPLPQLVKEISALGLKAAVVVRAGGEKGHMATGFWIHERGYAATCIDAVFVGIPDAQIEVGVPLPVFAGHLMELGGGSFYTQALSPSHRDGLAVLRVLNSPFERNMNAFASAIDPKTGKREGFTEEHLVPELLVTLPSIGEQIFLFGLEPGDAFAPGFSTIPANIVSVRWASDGPFAGIRIFAQLPFKSTYCGAPFFNSKKQIVGLAEKGAPDGETAIIPATTILALMRSVGLD